MNDELALFIVIMTVLVTTGVLTLNWMRGRQRLAELTAGQNRKGEADREVALLADENAGLRKVVQRLEGRIGTLERIVTDPAERTAQEIEGLR